MKGIVYKSTGSSYTVKTEAGERLECRIKGKFRTRGIKSTNPVVVGDYVEFELEAAGDETVGIIHHICDRKNYIVRKSVKLSKRTHIIAANIDQAFLMVTLKNPPTYTIFIDRFLVTAEAYGIKAILLFNKIDTYTGAERKEIDALVNIYTKIGYECLCISAVKGENTDKVKAAMKGKTSMFSGHSGVGKSTLINTVAPGLDLRTAPVSEQHMQGQHTTTFAEMYDLGEETAIIDTPGIKGFGIVEMEKEEIGDYFPEFFALKPQCKFYNCMHVEEPRCAVKAALENNEIAESRYKSYLQMLQNEEEEYRTDVYKG